MTLLVISQGLPLDHRNQSKRVKNFFELNLLDRLQAFSPEPSENSQALNQIDESQTDIHKEQDEQNDPNRKLLPAYVWFEDSLPDGHLPQNLDDEMKLYVQSEDSPPNNNPAVNKTISGIFIELIEQKMNQMNQSTEARPTTEMDENEMKHSKNPGHPQIWMSKILKTKRSPNMSGLKTVCQLVFMMKGS